jgi:site-specific recombinase XerD
MQVLEQKVYSNFVDSIASTATKQSYIYALKLYMKFIKTDRYSDLFKGDIYENIKSFIIFLRNSNKSTRTIKVKLYALKSFYEMNDVDIGYLKWKKLSKYKGEESNIHEDRSYTHEEIQRILNVCDLRTRLSILLMCSSGVRIGSQPSLTVGSIEGQKVTVYANTSHKYISFITPECQKALTDYLDWRGRVCGEKITPTSPLLRRDFNTAPRKIRPRVEFCSLDSLRKSIWKAIVKSGLREVDHVSSSRKEVMQCHGYRKFFQTQWPHSINVI